MYSNSNAPGETSGNSENEIQGKTWCHVSTINHGYVQTSKPNKYTLLPVKTMNPLYNISFLPPFLSKSININNLKQQLGGLHGSTVCSPMKAVE